MLGSTRNSGWIWGALKLGETNKNNFIDMSHYVKNIGHPHTIDCTIKSALLTCSIKLWYDIALKRAGTCCVVDGDSSKTTEQILATCIVFVVSPDLPLSFGWGSPFLLKWNTFIFDGIDCWVDAFYLNLCWHVSGTAVVVYYLYVVVYYFDFSLGKVVLNPPTIIWVTRTFFNFF